MPCKGLRGLCILKKNDSHISSNKSPELELIISISNTKTSFYQKGKKRGQRKGRLHQIHVHLLGYSLLLFAVPSLFVSE